MNCSTYWQTSDLYLNDRYLTSSLSFCPIYPSAPHIQTTDGPFPTKGQIEVCSEDGTMYTWAPDRVEKWYPAAPNGDQLKEIWLNPLTIQTQMIKGVYTNSTYSTSEQDGIYARIEGKEYTWFLEQNAPVYVYGFEYRFHRCLDGLLHTEEEYYEESNQQAMCPCRLENYRIEQGFEASETPAQAKQEAEDASYYATAKKMLDSVYTRMLRR